MVIKECSRGCNHAWEDCLCGCEECQNIDSVGTANPTYNDNTGEAILDDNGNAVDEYEDRIENIADSVKDIQTTLFQENKRSEDE